MAAKKKVFTDWIMEDKQKKLDWISAQSDVRDRIFSRNSSTPIGRLENKKSSEQKASDLTKLEQMFANDDKFYLKIMARWRAFKHRQQHRHSISVSSDIYRKLQFLSRSYKKSSVAETVEYLVGVFELQPKLDDAARDINKMKVAQLNELLKLNSNKAKLEKEMQEMAIKKLRRIGLQLLDSNNRYAAELSKFSVELSSDSSMIDPDKYPDLVKQFNSLEKQASDLEAALLEQRNKPRLGAAYAIDPPDFD